MKNNRKISTIAALLGATVLWSSAFSAIRYALQFYSAGHIVLLRFLSASILLIMIAFWKKIGLPRKADLPFFIKKD